MRVIVNPNQSRREQAREWAVIASDGDIAGADALAAALTSIALSLTVLTDAVSQMKEAHAEELTRLADSVDAINRMAENGVFSA